MHFNFHKVSGKPCEGYPGVDDRELLGGGTKTKEIMNRVAELFDGRLEMVL